MAAPATATSPPQIDPQARTAALVAQHGAALLHVACRVSLCADDAHDAFQRALEIYLRRLDTIDPRTEAAWMRVVVRNEALAVRKSRSQLVASDDVDFDSHVDEHQRGPQERIESAERVTRSAEALRGLKPDEARALLMKAEGLSYAEIGDQLGWTYTKVNRCVTEGRARFRRLFGGIENGEQCERFGPLLLALAESRAGADELVVLKPHLRHCIACRAEVRRLHGARWPLAAFLPLPAFLERLRPGQVKADLYALFARVGSSEPVAQSLAAGGGGRSASAAALMGICLAGASAGGYCALGGPLPGDADAHNPGERERIERRADAADGASLAARPPVGDAPARVATASASAPPSPGPASVPKLRVRRTPAAAKSTAAGTGEFSFEEDSTEPAPAPAPTADPQPTTASEPTARPAANSQQSAGAPTAAARSGGSEFSFER